MEPADNVPRRWDESDFVEEIVSDLESLEGVCEVEWIQQNPHCGYQDLIRLKVMYSGRHLMGTRRGNEETFDDAFTQYLLEPLRK